jgi:UDPglucose 6-dehydrogenase
MREALVDADAAVIVTEWNEFRAVVDPTARKLMRRPLLIDGRNLLDPALAAHAGFEYESVGRPDPEAVPAVSS